MKKPADMEDDETVRILSAAETQVALARYRLRATAHRIIDDAERLLVEVEGPARDAWRDALGKALLGGQRLRAVIDRWTPPAPPRLESLLAAIRAPQEAVVDAMSALLALIPTNAVDEQVMQDARVVREAAIGMLATQDPAQAKQLSPSGILRAPAPLDQKARILVVDDDASLRKQLVKVLERLGYATTQAQNGREALERAEKDSPDLVITDLDMPEMNGFEFLYRVKSSEQTQHIPVIVVSGEGDAESVVKCLEQGAEDHLTKPYEPVVLKARIRTSLEKKRMRDLEMAYLRRVAQLTAAAEAVEQHSYESASLADLLAQGDQLGHLARVFDRMVNGIRTREEQLEGRLRELRREIEHVSKESTDGAEASEGSSFAVGDVVAGRYEIRRELGKGGMGMVYLARDRELAEDVALKVVRRDVIGEDPSLLERLKSEMRLARKISHRNVVRSHDLGEWEGTYFLTMEYIKGVTVADLLATRGRLTVDSTLAIATQLADALAVAHSAGIIHRDIKPHNLLVDDEGALKVMDFGLARPIKRTEAGLTLSGYIVGTPKYMAMEQLVGGDVDARSDLFATGVVLYECLTGRVPFDADSPMGIIAKMVDSEPTPIRELEPSVPAGLASVIERLLQREPEKRFKSAREVADRLALVR